MALPVLYYILVPGYGRTDSVDMFQFKLNQPIIINVPLSPQLTTNWPTGPTTTGHSARPPPSRLRARLERSIFCRLLDGDVGRHSHQGLFVSDVSKPSKKKGLITDDLDLEQHPAKGEEAPI